MACALCCVNVNAGATARARSRKSATAGTLASSSSDGRCLGSGAASGRVFETIRTVVPVLEQLSFDEAFGEPAEIAGSTTAEVEQFCEALRARVLAETGLVSSVGAGSGKQVAKIASGLAKPDGVRVEDCQRASRELGDVLDAAGLIEEAYDLEVSSPGLDRQLRKDRELRWAVGKRVRRWLSGGEEHQGRLVGVDDGVLTLEHEGAREELPRARVTKARLDIEVPWQRRPSL